MDSDLLFVLGFVFLVLAIPAVISAFVDGRTPRAPMLIILLGGGMMAYAVSLRPNAYSIAGLPDTFARVVAQLFN